MEHRDASFDIILERYSEIFSSQHVPIDEVRVMNLISELLIEGDYYYYLRNSWQEINHVHAHFCRIHGLSTVPQHLQQVIDLIHPDDIDFVLHAETSCLDKILEIGVKYLKSLKLCYCFRMRVADGSYRLFHHQAVSLVTDEEDKIVWTLVIHTDITHLSVFSSHIATVVGIHDRHDFHQMDLSSEENKPKNILTKRELQIVRYIAQGKSSVQIGGLLDISLLTVQVHRKNILRKTDAKNSASLIRRCIELGFLMYANIICTSIENSMFSISLTLFTCY